MFLKLAIFAWERIAPTAQDLENPTNHSKSAEPWNRMHFDQSEPPSSPVAGQFLGKRLTQYSPPPKTELRKVKFVKPMNQVLRACENQDPSLPISHTPLILPVLSGIFSKFSGELFRSCKFHGHVQQLSKARAKPNRRSDKCFKQPASKLKVPHLSPSSQTPLNQTEKMPLCIEILGATKPTIPAVTHQNSSPPSSSKPNAHRPSQMPHWLQLQAALTASSQASKLWQTHLPRLQSVLHRLQSFSRQAVNAGLESSHQRDNTPGEQPGEFQAGRGQKRTRHRDSQQLQLLRQLAGTFPKQNTVHQGKHRGVSRVKPKPLPSYASIPPPTHPAATPADADNINTGDNDDREGMDLVKLLSEAAHAQEDSDEFGDNSCGLPDWSRPTRT